MYEEPIIDVNFKKSDKKYYLLFKTPKNIVKKVSNLEKVLLKRVNKNKTILNIEYDEGKKLNYSYDNMQLILLENMELSVV